MGPLLTGELADEARAAAGDIVAALVDDAARTADIEWPFLAGGAAGTAVVLATWAAATGDGRARAAADVCIDRALAGAATARFTGDLYGGILGIGWALARIEHLDGVSDDEDRDDDLLADKILSATPWPGVHDLTRGLVGIGIHALERWPAPGAQRRVAAVVARLEETAQPAEPGVRWWTDPSTVLPERRTEYPQGYIDLGVAHGVAGVVAFLAVAAALGVDGARPLAAAAGDHLLSWGRDEAPYGRYPALVADRDNPGGSRLAWCYGDAGIAWALSVAGHALGDDALLAEARTTALAAARRPAGTAGVRDAALCHGALGVAHALACVGEPIGDDVIVNASRAWVRHALTLRRDPAEGVAGFVSITPDGGGFAESASKGLLEGAGGIAVSLLSATTGDAAQWDRFLMPQLPAPPAR